MDKLLELLDVIIEYLLIPAVVIISGVMIKKLLSFASKVTDSTIEKNEAESLNAITSIKDNIRNEINTIVQTAVCSTMPLVEELKLSHPNGKMTQSDIRQISDVTHKLIYDSLPKSLIDEDGSWCKIMGGRVIIDNIINGFIEKHVTEQKSIMNNKRT